MQVTVLFAPAVYGKRIGLVQVIALPAIHVAATALAAQLFSAVYSDLALLFGERYPVVRTWTAYRSLALLFAYDALGLALALLLRGRMGRIARRMRRKTLD